MSLLPLATSTASSPDIPLWLSGPFVLLLLLIAVMPLAPARLKHLWEHYYPHVAVALAAGMGAFYLLRIPGGGEVLQHTATEYVSFISLIGSLFVISGGIHLRVRDEATPLANVVFLAVGAVAANIIGTTGASMVLIRPWIRMNKIRISAFHVIFFIFIVSNVGGALTPIGDPPLFLGYLRGVPFFWLLEHVVVHWLFTVGLLLAVFYLLDRRSYNRAPAAIRADIDRPAEEFKLEGKLNLLLLGVVVGAVFLPEKFFLRESVMLLAAAISYGVTAKEIHARNHFTFGPIREVAFLFVGIFITMMPALGYIDRHGRELGLEHPRAFYVATGSLSAVLDNAPTYATFLRVAESRAVAQRPAEFADSRDERDTVRRMLGNPTDAAAIVAISLGAVFFGAMTYIGNGPNFMVKAIADSASVHTPSFFGFILKFSLPILLPILLLGGWLFL